MRGQRRLVRHSPSVTRRLSVQETCVLHEEVPSVDNMSKEARSRTMAAMRSKDTRIELTLRRALWSEGLRYRIHAKLPGRPDIVFHGRKVAVFCDGCFWHGCPECNLVPKQNRHYWVEKIRRNQMRDRMVTEQLEREGWRVLRFWGCEIRNDLVSVVERVKEAVGRD